MLTEVERRYVTDAITKGDISGIYGNYLTEFEKSFATFCGTKHAALVNSGTTALHIALVALNIGPGDEVIVPDLTMMATFFAVLYQGATPVTIDSDPETGNINPAQIEEKITERTKAIMVVHLFGHPVDMDPILAIAREHNLYVIEDAAEAHGAEYKGKKVGSIGDIGCFSFYSNKIVTTGEGGGLTSDNTELIERVKLLKNLAFGEKQKLMHQALGYKYQMTNIQAAIGAAQMTHIDDIIKKKRTIAAYYLKALADIPEIDLPVEKPYARNVYWMFTVTLKGRLVGKRERVMELLEKEGVQTRENFVPFNQQEYFIKQGLAHPELCPIAKHIGENSFYIPSGTDISEDEQATVVAALKKAIVDA